MAHTVGRLIVDSLEAHDIDLVYCVPGESYLGFTNAMADNNRMPLIVCRHEGGGGFDAAAVLPMDGDCLDPGGAGGLGLGFDRAGLAAIVDDDPRQVTERLGSDARARPAQQSRTVSRSRNDGDSSCGKRRRVKTHTRPYDMVARRQTYSAGDDTFNRQLI